MCYSTWRPVVDLVLGLTPGGVSSCKLFAGCTPTSNGGRVRFRLGDRLISFVVFNNF